MTALLFSVGQPSRENLEIVQALLDRGADVNHPESTQGDTALLLAALIGQTRSVRLLLERGAAINLQDAASLAPLIGGVYSGSLPMVQLLLARGADPFQVT